MSRADHRVQYSSCTHLLLQRHGSSQFPVANQSRIRPEALQVVCCPPMRDALICKQDRPVRYESTLSHTKTQKQIYIDWAKFPIVRCLHVHVHYDDGSLQTQTSWPAVVPASARGDIVPQGVCHHNRLPTAPCRLSICSTKGSALLSHLNIIDIWMLRRYTDKLLHARPDPLPSTVLSNHLRHALPQRSRSSCDGLDGPAAARSAPVHTEGNSG